MEISEIGTLKHIPMNRRRGILRSQTVDTFFHILSLCYSDSSPIDQISDKGKTETCIESVPKNNVSLDSAAIITNYSICEEQMVMDETQVVLDNQEGGIHNKPLESAETQAVLDGTDIIPNDSNCQEQMFIDETQVVFDTEEGGLDSKPVEPDVTQVVLDTQDNGLDSELVESTQVLLGSQEGGLNCKLMESTETQLMFDTQEGGLNNKLVESVETQVILDSTDITLNDSLSQLQMFMDLDTNEDILCNELTESVKCYDNLLGESNDLSLKFDTNPSTTSDIKNDNNFNKDVEEGEISGELMDFITEDKTQSVDKTGIEREDSVVVELGLDNGHNSIPLSADIVENVGKDTTRGVSKTARNLVDYSEVVVPRKPREYAKPVSSEHVLPPLGNLKNSATKNQDIVYPLEKIGEQKNKKRAGSWTEDEQAIKKAKKSADKNSTSVGELSKDTSQKVVDTSVNEDASNVKKKKRVMSKERKAKKKRKERIKRAENNRKLGVKRLKLEPMIKEKKVTYCRHFMVGRCHEGDKCKFSHDTIPLTKSQACFHFARHDCMKGDDCSYDHDLSKYPCNNFLTKGFCHRGSDCLFSHEAKPSEAPLDASKESKLEKKVDTKSCSVPIEQNTVEIIPKLSAKPPKGISFLKTPPVNQDSKDTTKNPTLIQYSKKKFKTSPAVQDSEEITKTPPIIQEIKKTAPVTPRGINFLSFGKKPGLEQSNGGFTFKISNGTKKSRLSNLDDKCLKSESTLNAVNEVKVTVDFLSNKPSSSQKPIAMLPFMSSISQKSLQSTLDFASKLDSGVKINRQI